MKSKMLKRAIAIMLCMVIVMGGAEHMRAGSSEGTEETTTETAEEEIVLSDDGDENPVADAEEGQPKAQTEETPSEEGQSESKAEEGQSGPKAEEGQSESKTEEGQSGAQNPDAGETKTGESEENIPEEELKEKPIMELTYEDSQVSIRVTADEEGNIPQGASLSVTPIEKQEIHDDMDADAKAEAEELNAQYDATAEKLQEKAQGEEYDILGFLAYDITFVDENGDKLEPNGSVSVSMDYKEAAIPEEVKIAREAGAEVADVTLMHLEESSDGAVKDVVDMVADESQEANVQTTEATEVEAAEFVTESFSTFTLVWKGNGRVNDLVIKIVDTNGDEIAATLSPASKEINGETDVASIAPEIADYTFEGAVYGESFNTASTLQKVRVVRYGWWGDYYWRYNNGTEWIWMTNGNQLYFVYSPKSTGEVEDTGLGAPEHKKTIEKKSEDKYTLSLDVTGAVGKTKPIDVLLIVDCSGSMKGTRMSNVNTAINTLLDELNKSEVKDTINVAIAWFAGNKGTWISRENYWDTSTEQAWNDAGVEKGWDTLANTKNNFTGMRAIDPSGTNWQAGIKVGNSLLSSGRSDASKYVVFLTDGEPTFYYDTNGKTKGSGSDYEPNAYQFAEREWKAVGSGIKKAKSYIVDATGATNERCTSFASSVGGTYLNGANSANLTSAFSKIAGDITKPSYTNVSITDTLSVYADFDEDLNFDVFKKSKNGVETKMTEETDYTYTKEGKEISIHLLNGTPLEEDVTYTVRFDITPTDKAYFDKLMYNGYNGVKGDEGTDTDPNNPTSAGKDGFYSNDLAKVNYTTGGKNDSSNYGHPVIQVKTNTTTYAVQKQWKGGAEAEATVKLVAKYDARNEKGYESNGESDDGLRNVPESYRSLTAEHRANVTLNDSNKWQKTWEDLPAEYYYIDNNGEIAHTSIIYSVEEVNVPDGYTVSYENLLDSKNKVIGTLVTNTGNSRWEIVKQSSSTATDGSTINLQGAEFELKGKTADKADKIYKGVSDENGVVVWKETVDGVEQTVEMIPRGTYILKEVKAPNGYSLSDVEWSIDTTQITPTIKRGDTFVAYTESETDGSKVYTFVFENDPVYELPSTGGIGTYWYTIGGMLLMMAAALILYKKKKDTK